MTASDIKTLLGISTDDATKDMQYYMMIPSLVDFAKTECKDDFLDEDGEEVLPLAVKLFVAKAAQYFEATAGLTAESLGDWQGTFSEDIPRGIMRLLPRKARFV